MSGWLAATVSTVSPQGLVAACFAHGSAIILSSGASSKDELGRCDDALIADAATGVLFVCGCDTKQSLKTLGGESLITWVTLRTADIASGGEDHR